MMTTVLARPESSQITSPDRTPTSSHRRHNLMLGLVLLVSGLLAVRLRNTAFIDEALYINAGHAHLEHWMDGRPLGDAGAFFSGAPALYPVLAALLDSVGGLYLVRTFSLLCILGTGMLLHGIGSHLWDRRAGLLAATTFLLAGPVVFTSFLGTFDAPVLFLVTLALWLGLTRRSLASAILLGGVLALATMTKYTAGIFIPVALGSTLLLGHAGVRRALIGLSATTGILTAVWMQWGDSLADDLAFTTTQREALTPASTGFLLGLLTDHIGHLILLTIITLAVLLLGWRKGRESWRWTLVAVGLAFAASALPVGQLFLGEAVSFEKHLAYSTLMLALPIGWALAKFSRLPLMVPAVVVLVLVMWLFGVVRGFYLYQWTNVAGVTQAIEFDPQPGLYLSSSADVLAYHTKDLPGVAWETTFELYFEGEDEVRAAVENERYEAIIVRSATVGSQVQDEAQAVLLNALESSEAYDLAFQPFSAGAPGDTWLVYTHR